jgi:lipopolysaccharide/colanic/teichoic acid biosynthesis glycosyltransferase
MEASPLPIQKKRRPTEVAHPAPAPLAAPAALPPLLVGPLLARRWYPACKGVIDFVFASLLCVPGLPIVLLAALIIKLTSKGPAFYTQARVGRHGRVFTIFKLRSMIHNCESLTGPRWSIPGDPRVTPFGWFLRVSHLDELPQLLNVLLGDMSLIGPRPERPEFISELQRAYPAYSLRLEVRPGVTGLAQVQLPADSDLDSVRRKLSCDLYYVRHISPWLDLRLLICTALYAIGVPFRIAGLCLAIPASGVSEQDLRDVLSREAVPAFRRSA